MWACGATAACLISRSPPLPRLSTLLNQILNLISPFAVGLEDGCERELTLGEMMGALPVASGQLGSERLALLALGVPAATTAQNTAGGSCGRLCTG